MRKLCTALLSAALACLAFAAMAVSRLSASLSQFTPYEAFVKCSWKAECVGSTHKLSTEKVIQIHKSTHNKFFEVKNPIAKHLENPLLGNNCYVGYQELITNQTETFYELSQRKNHLA
jgi:di/tripeptidase